MAKKLLDSKLLYVILSVILAFCLWYYVTTVEGDTSTNIVNNIPVTFLGEDVLRENGLMITSETPRVSVEFEANRITLGKLNLDTITASVDVSILTQEGAFPLGYELSYSGVSTSSFTVLEKRPMNITINVERYVTREIEIRGAFTGQQADGYIIDLENGQPKFEFTPATITVSGRASDVERISHALVTVDNDILSETIRGDFPYELIGADGEPLDRASLNIECSTETVATVLRVKQVVSLPLTVTFEDGGGATLAENVTWDIEPKTITVAGEAADLESLIARGELNVGAIDLAEIVQTGETVEIKRTIPLAEELTNVDGVTEATITLTINGLATRTFEVTDFTIQNKPEGYNARIVTKALTVTVRGKEEELEQISAANLRVVADLSDINLSPGQYTIEAKIYFDGTGSAGVVETNYLLAVRLSRQ